MMPTAAAAVAAECKPPIIAKRRAPHTRVASMPKRRAPNNNNSSSSSSGGGSGSGSGSNSEIHSNSNNDDDNNNNSNNNNSQWKSTESPMDLSNYVVKVGSSDNGDDAAVNDDDKDDGGDDDDDSDDDEIDDDAVKKSARRNTNKSKDNHKPKSKVVPKTVAVKAITTKGKESAKTSVTKESSSKSVRFA